MVSLIFLGAAVQASYALTEHGLPAIIFDAFKMGILAQHTPRLFLDETFDIDANESVVDSLDLNASFDYFFMVGFGFILMVSMSNIFIQVMGEAYSSSKAQVKVTLTRVRARECLIDAMFLAGLPQCLASICGRRKTGYNQFVWFTQEGVDAANDVDDVDVGPVVSKQAIIAAVSVTAAVAHHSSRGIPPHARAEAVGRAVAKAVDPFGELGELDKEVEKAVMLATGS